jgi:hypothetical protein
LQKQKFLETEEKKDMLKAQVTTTAQPKIVDSGVFTVVTSTSSPTTKPDVVVSDRSASSPTGNVNVKINNIKASKTTEITEATTTTTKSKKGNNSLWFSLDQQMSAFEAADAERRKAEEAKRKQEEEEKKKAEDERRARLGLDDNVEDLEEVRKRIAEQARQRLVQEDAERHTPVKAVASSTTATKVEQISHPPQLPTLLQEPVGANRFVPSQPGAPHHQNHSAHQPQQQQHHHHQQQQQQHPHPANQQPFVPWHPHQQKYQHHPMQSSKHQYGHHHSRQVSGHNSPDSQYHQNQHQQPTHGGSAHVINASHHPTPTTSSQPQEWQPIQNHQARTPLGGGPGQNTSTDRGHHTCAANEKYAAMANQSDDGHLATTRIKHTILIQWALQPPQLQLLRPIEALLTTIHQIFPPALGLLAHDYFAKWKPITSADTVDEEQLNKAVRKVRFFLHPDKLPRDFSEEQKFTCKLLWDVTNDSYEDYKKGKEDLDWMK